MAIKFGNDLDLEGNQIKNFVAHSSSVAPLVPKGGMLWWDNVNKILKCYNESISLWKSVITDSEGGGVLVSDYLSLADAVAQLGATPVTLYINSPQTVTANLVIPSTLLLRVISPNVITINNGVTLTINGPLSAGLYQIFEGTGTVVLGPGTVVEVYPQWWGAVVDGVSDDSTAIQSAINTDQPVYLSRGNYGCNADIELLPGTRITGIGNLYFSGNYGISANNADYFQLKGFGIIGADGASQAGVFVHNATARWLIENLYIDHVKYGVYVTNSWIGEIRGGVIQNNTQYGIYFTNGDGNCSKGTPFSASQGILIASNIEIVSSVVGIQLGDLTNGGSGSMHVGSVTVEKSVVHEGDGNIGVVCENTRGVHIGGYFEANAKGIVLQGEYNESMVIEECQFWGSAGKFNPAIEMKSTTYMRQIAIRNCFGNALTNTITGTAILETLVLDNNRAELEVGLLTNINAATYVTFGLSNTTGQLPRRFSLANKDLVGDPVDDIKISQSGAIFTNELYTATRLVRIPPADGSGMTYQFINNNGTHALRIRPYSTQYIRGLADSKYKELTTNACIKLITVTADYWDIVSQNGTINDEL